MLSVLDDKERPMHTLSKPAQQSPHKIDGAMAAVLAWEARGDAISEGAVWMGDVAPTEPQQSERACVAAGDGPGVACLRGRGVRPDGRARVIR
jgi:hypothetical protein